MVPTNIVSVFEDVPLMEFMHLVTRMPGETQVFVVVFDIFRVLITSLVFEDCTSPLGSVLLQNVFLPFN